MLSKKEYNEVREKLFSKIKKEYDEQCKIYKPLYKTYPNTVSALESLYRVWLKRDTGSLESLADAIRVAIKIMEADPSGNLFYSSNKGIISNFNKIYIDYLLEDQDKVVEYEEKRIEEEKNNKDKLEEEKKINDLNESIILFKEEIDSLKKTNEKLNETIKDMTLNVSSIMEKKEEKIDKNNKSNFYANPPYLKQYIEGATIEKESKSLSKINEEIKIYNEAKEEEKNLTSIIELLILIINRTSNKTNKINLIKSCVECFNNGNYLPKSDAGAEFFKKLIEQFNKDNFEIPVWNEKKRKRNDDIINNDGTKKIKN